MKLKKAVMALSAMGMVLSPLAAHAGTTAASSAGKITNALGKGERKTTNVRAKHNLSMPSGGMMTATMAAVGGMVVGVVIAKKNNNDPASPVT